PHYLNAQESCTFLFFLLIRPPQRSTLFPYTTLFRSEARMVVLRSSATFTSMAGEMERASSGRSFCTRSITSTMLAPGCRRMISRDRKSTRLNSSHDQISYAVFCLKKKKKIQKKHHRK